MATAIEYGLIAALIATVIIGGVSSLGNSFKKEDVKTAPTISADFDSIPLGVGETPTVKPGLQGQIIITCPNGLRLQTTFTEDVTSATCKAYLRR